MGLTPHVVVLGPEHAQLAEKDGWTKEQYRKNFWEKVRQPVSWYPKTCFEFINKEPKYKLFVEEQYGIPFTPETIFPLTVKPELIHIIVGGGSGRHSHFFTPFYETFPVSKLVKE
jgi:hypothetical protein